MARAQFPKWVYGEKGATRIVNSEQEESELEGAWYDSPADVPKSAEQEQAEQEAEASKAPDLPMEGGPRDAMATLPKDHTYYDRVVAEAEALGMKVDKRWTMETLMRKVREHGST